MPGKNEIRYHKTNRTSNKQQNKQLRKQSSVSTNSNAVVSPRIAACQHKTTASTDSTRKIPGKYKHLTSDIHGIPNDNTTTKVNNEESVPIKLPEVWSLNINGMKPTHAQKWKVTALSEMIKAEECNIPFIIITETHFKPDHNAAEINIDGYNVHRADRTPRKNAGVAIYYKDNLVTNDSLTYSDDYCQAVTLYIQSLNLIVAGVYRPPNATDNQVNSFRSLISKLNDFIQKYPTADVQVQGDFNMKFIQWQSLSLKPGHGQRLSEQHCAETLVNFMQENFLSQLVTENTRNDSSLLDLVITNNAEMVHSIEVEKTRLSDHDMLRTKLTSEKFVHINMNESYIPEHPFDKLNLHKAKWEPIKKNSKK